MSETKIQCIDCPTVFTVSDGEKEFLATHFDKNGSALSIPKRCKDCRIKKRARYDQKEQRQKTSQFMDKLKSGDRITLQ